MFTTAIVFMCTHVGVSGKCSNMTDFDFFLFHNRAPTTMLATMTTPTTRRATITPITTPTTGNLENARLALGTTVSLGSPVAKGPLKAVTGLSLAQDTSRW